jgi:hypothetical protein
VIAATGLAFAAHAAGVYKWTDAQGHVHFDDNNLLEQRLTLDGLRAHSIPPRSDSKAPQDFANAVKQRCDDVRERLAGYRSATTLEGRDPAGNIYVMSPRQAQVEIAIAEREQTRYCAPGATDRLYHEPLPVTTVSKITPVEQR